jgi:hypothetical protein
MSKNKINGKKKLLLKRETLRELKEGDMGEAAGGVESIAGTWSYSSVIVLTAKCNTMACGTLTCIGCRIY